MTRVFKLLSVLIVLCSLMPLNAADAVSISVTPSVATQRGTVRARVLVARDVRNRTLTWEVEGPGIYQSSRQDLNGADSPRSYFFMLRNLPVGPLELRASVRRNDDSVTTSRGTLIVLGMK